MIGQSTFVAVAVVVVASILLFASIHVASENVQQQQQQQSIKQSLNELIGENEIREQVDKFLFDSDWQNCASRQALLELANLARQVQTELPQIGAQVSELEQKQREICTKEMRKLLDSGVRGLGATLPGQFRKIKQAMEAAESGSEKDRFVKASLDFMLEKVSHTRWNSKKGLAKKRGQEEFGRFYKIIVVNRCRVVSKQLELASYRYSLTSEFLGADEDDDEMKFWLEMASLCKDVTNSVADYTAKALEELKSRHP